MSMERKDLLGLLEGWFNDAHRDLGLRCRTPENCRKAYREIKQLIQKPEIDEKWLENKTFEMIDIVSKGNILEAMRFIKSIISVIPREKKAEVNRMFLEKMAEESVYILHQEMASFFEKKFKEAGVKIK